MKTVPQIARLGEEGADSSLTLPLNSQTASGNVVEDHGTKVFGSEDAAIGNVYAEVGATELDHCALLEALEEARGRALVAKDGRAPFFYGDRCWLIRGRGIPVGGKNGIYMHYLLEGGGVLFMVNQSRYPSGFNFNCRWAAMSEVLMEHDGLEKVYPMVQQCWKALGVRVLEERWNRLDAAADVPIELETFVHALESGQFVHKFKKVTIHQKAAGKWEGVTMGKGAIVMRIYDKRSELFEKRAVSKQAIMNERRYAWSDDGPVTRVEVQIRGEALKKWDVFTYEDWKVRFGPIMEYLLHDHTRMVEGLTDRTHTSRVAPCDAWQEVITAFRQIAAGGRSSVPLRPTPRFGATVRALVKQAIGCLCTAVALEEGGGDVVEQQFSRESIFEIISRILHRESIDVDLVERVVSRVYDIATTRPSSPVWFVKDDVRPCQIPEVSFST